MNTRLELSYSIKVSSDNIDSKEIQLAYVVRASVIDDLANERKDLMPDAFQTVYKMRSAMEQMPQGKKGIVVASGGNTEYWKSKGWKTLDINPDDHADYVADANHMNKVIDVESQDFLLAECPTLEPNGMGGIGWGRLLHQANEVLKTGGIMSIKTAAFEGASETTLPPVDWFSETMTQHGFNVTVETEPVHEYSPGKTAQRIIYHGQKVANGFDASRVTPSHKK